MKKTILALALASLSLNAYAAGDKKKDAKKDAKKVDCAAADMQTADACGKHKKECKWAADAADATKGKCEAAAAK